MKWRIVAAFSDLQVQGYTKEEVPPVSFLSLTFQAASALVRTFRKQYEGKTLTAAIVMKWSKKGLNEGDLTRKPGSGRKLIDLVSFISPLSNEV